MTEQLQTIELPVKGMDCAECTEHVKSALCALPGVKEASVFLSSEKAVVRLDPTTVKLSALRGAVEKAGYSVPATSQLLEVSVKGMDCADCTVHVQKAISSLPGVEEVTVLLSSEKARIRLDPLQVDLPSIRRAVEAAGYTVPLEAVSQSSVTTDTAVTGSTGSSPALPNYFNSIMALLGLVLGAVLLIIVGGEWLGLFETLTDKLPWPVGWAIVLVAGYPIFRNVIRATLRGRIISHTLMSLGALAALAVGQWPTAAVVVFFMRVGEYAERFTTERSRQALRKLTSLVPQTARVERNGVEQEVPVGQVQPGEIVVVRPGDKIPVDGVVLSGQATVEQAAITGESLPVEVGEGDGVYAATIARLGSLRIQTTHVGADTTFGKAVKMVEEAEAHRAEVQLLADRFSAYYLPVVVAVSASSFIFTRNPLSSAAVLVVACSCSFALATPIAMLASIGAAARHGLLIKGGKYLEVLARADVLLVDKTGTLTAGRPRITDIVPLKGRSAAEVLGIAAAAERYSEHPLAQAVLAAARQQQIKVSEPQNFRAVPGMGVQALVDGNQVTVGNRRLEQLPPDLKAADELEEHGKTLLFVVVDGELIGILGAADTLRPEVPQALAAVRKLGIKKIELLTGDNERTGRALAGELGIDFRANLLPEDKIKIVRDYQSQGYRVVMVGDGVNDAPALAQADVGMAMGAAGTDIAIEAAHLALMRDDWWLVPEALAIAKRTMRVVKANFAFTVLYNLLGLSLAATGVLPMIVAAAAQSIPDFGILANSSRLLRYKPLKFAGVAGLGPGPGPAPVSPFQKPGVAQVANQPSSSVPGSPSNLVEIRPFQPAPVIENREDNACECCNDSNSRVKIVKAQPVKLKEPIVLALKVKESKPEEKKSGSQVQVSDTQP